MRVNDRRVYRVVDYPFRLAAPSDEAGERLRRYLAPLLDRASLPFELGGQRLPLFELEMVHRRYIATLDGRHLGDDPDPALPILQLVWRVSYEAIPRMRSRLAFHAGAVRLGGAGVVLPAPSRSGKSTLVAGLVVSGGSYLSDEIAPVNQRVVEPVPRPLHVDVRSVSLFPGLVERLPRVPDRAGFRERLVVAEDLREGSVGSACPIDVVVFPRYEEGATTTIQPLRRALGIAQLAQNSFNLDAFGSYGLEMIAEMARSACFFAMTSGDLAEAVNAIRSLVGAPAATLE